jgi:hypothetical protein
MTGTMPERLSQSMRDEHLAGGGVHIGRRFPRSDGRNGRRLRFSNRRMESGGIR